MNNTPGNDMKASDASDLMNRIMQHYSVHHEVVLVKLGHAQNATDISQKEENIAPAMPSNAWAEIIEMFQKCGITQEELFEIEAVLETLPKAIRPHFERLIEMDKMLQTMMKTMESLKYEEAKKIVSQIQTAPNPMSGLTRDDYDVEHEKSNDSNRVKAFKIVR